MTTKPKTRKTAAAKRAAPKAATNQAPGEPKREVTDVRKLVSRWHWLEADQTHRANLAKTEDESEKLITIHNDEQGAIESQLTTLVPTNYLDACYLLEFATILAKGACMAEDADVAILKNVRAGLRNAWNNAMQAEHKKATLEFRDGLCALLEIFHEPRHLRTLLDSLNRAAKIKTVDDRQAA
jgi:hypothetical protein